MAGSVIINVLFGFIGFIVVFSSAYINNSLQISMIRGFLAFVSFFLMAYLFRWMFHYIIKDSKGNTINKKEAAYKKTVNQSELNQSETIDFEKIKHSMTGLTKKKQ
jgi:hypothetical protein